MGGGPKARRQVRNKENKTKKVSFLQMWRWQHSKILLQSTDTGTRSLAGRTDVEGLRSLPNPFLPPPTHTHIHNIWFCSLTLVYRISSGRMLIITPAVSFARQQNNLDFISLSAADLGCLGRACRSTNNVSGPKCAPMRIAQGPEVLSISWDGCNVTTVNVRLNSSTRQLSGGFALNKVSSFTFRAEDWYEADFLSSLSKARLISSQTVFNSLCVKA